MSAALDDLRRRTLACSWADPGFLRPFQVVRWQPLDAAFELHQPAAEAVAEGKASAEALDRLYDWTEVSVLDVKERWGDGSLHAAFAAARAPLDADRRLRDVNTGWATIEAWVERDRPDPALVELAETRQRLGEDYEWATRIRLRCVDTPERLIHGAVCPLPVSELRELRGELLMLTSKAAA